MYKCCVSKKKHITQFELLDIRGIYLFLSHFALLRAEMSSSLCCSTPARFAYILACSVCIYVYLKLFI